MSLSVVNSEFDFSLSIDPLAMLGYLHRMESGRKFQLLFLAILQSQSREYTYEWIDDSLGIALLAAENKVSPMDCLHAAHRIDQIQESLLKRLDDNIMGLYHLCSLLNCFFYTAFGHDPISRAWYMSAWIAVIYSCRATARDLSNFAQWTIDFDAVISACSGCNYDSFDFSCYEADPSPIADMVREIFSPTPYSPPAINPSWLSWNNGIVSKMAKNIYNNDRFSDLAILADAIEEAGCKDKSILSHCRNNSDHVRGCWVIDLFLDKK